MIILEVAVNLFTRTWFRIRSVTSARQACRKIAVLSLNRSQRQLACEGLYKALRIYFFCQELSPWHLTNKFLWILIRHVWLLWQQQCCRQYCIVYVAIFLNWKKITVCNESASNHMGCLKQYVKFTRSDIWKYTETRNVTTKHGINQSVRL